MVDVVDPKTRSRMMSGIRGKNTKPEVLIRKALHAGGFRFRLHRKNLPGSPDIVLPKFRAVILVNGCFWHGHQCRLFKWPKTRPEFWRNKIEGNIRRDQRKLSDLKSLGWRVCLVWECEIKGAKEENLNRVIESISKWLKGKESSLFIPDNRTQAISD
ncbi:very short patch repair endonuclease [Marinobacter sp. 1_MG-2023]|uniref:very short patch repair endonuclease n=1 Tax=Marinobacter sp. 1_MG-2023 TaxID=3062627 RepID=UPI0026E11B65|nr:very short patch repair endonuclease [Marinobacter sp. 1_MG-2023]MDO6824997.1 very short patch repair endonuclease [Marinobacter sp. 1_MG-2023]